jgi:tetratricopeptide (TPR) repeat protein
MFVKVLTSILVFASVGFSADNNLASGQYKTALDLYAKRDVVDSEGVYVNINTAIESLKSAAIAAEDADLKYDIALLNSRCNYWLGQHANNKDTKIVQFQKAMDAAIEAKAINGDFAEAHYFYGVALGRWAEANGVTASLGRKDELMQSMKDTKQRDTREFDKGETLDGMGPDRILGRTYYKLPFFAGGSRSESLKYLGVAFKGEPKFFLNGIYLAETLFDGGSSSEVAQACQILREISSKKPEEGFAHRIPENKEDILEAAASYKARCN